MSTLRQPFERFEDAASDAAERGQAAPVSAAEAAQPGATATRSKRSAKQWLKAGAALGAAAIAGAGISGLTTYEVTKSHNKTLNGLPQSQGSAALNPPAAAAAAPFAPPPPAAVKPAAASYCVAPELQTDAVFPTGPDAYFTADNRTQQLFSQGLPQPGDIAASGINHYLLSSDYYPLLESLVALQPQFVASNLRSDAPDAQGNNWYGAKLFNRPDPLGVPTQGWMKEGLGETYVDGAAWPQVYDNAMFRASQMGIRGQHSQGTGDLQDALSGNRDDAILLSGSPIEALALNAARATGSNQNITLFNDKDDNIPFVVEMMRTNPLLFGTLTFDFNQARTGSGTNTTLASNTTLRVNGSGIAVEPQGHPNWTIEPQAGGWVTYAISGMNADGLNLRLVVDPANATEKFLAYDAMANAADVLTLGRIYCGASPLVIA